MSQDNGSLRKNRCETCKHWMNERPLPGPDGKPVIGNPHVGDCDAHIYPVIAGIDQLGRVAQQPGGTWAITFAQSYCTRDFEPKVLLSSIANWGKNAPKAEPLAEVVTLDPPKDPA